MRIRGLHIDGFGHFADLELGPFDRPVTVLHGPNEAGKSTLLEFIRRVLFGFPDGRSRSNPYRPLAGGGHGGGVTIVGDGGETVTVRRFQGTGGGPVTLTAASGEPLADGELSRLLGHHSKDVFQNVFAFTLDELHDEALLSDDSVNSQIYSAGMGATKLPEALKTLNDGKGGLFLKSGRKHAIYDAAGGLDQVDYILRDVADNAAEYGRLSDQLEEVEAELQRLNHRRRESQSHLDRQRQLETAWDDWNELVTTEQQLADLPIIDEFPVDGVSRLEALEERVRGARREHESAVEDVTEAEARAEASVEYEAILDHSGDVDTLKRLSTSFHEAVRDLSKVKAELEEHKRSLTQTLKDLGPDWDEARLEAFDLSMAVREEISQHQERLRKAGEELARRESALAQDQNALEESTEAENRAKQELEASARPTSRKNNSKALAAIAAIGVAAGIALLAMGPALGGTTLPLGIAGGLVFLTLAGIAAYLLTSGQSSTGADAEYARLSRELANAIELTKQRKDRTERSGKAVELAKSALESIESEWRQWLAERGLRETFLPENVVEVRSKIELGLTQRSDVRSWQQRIDAIQGRIVEYTTTVEPLASEFAVAFDDNDPRIVAAAADRLFELHVEVERKVGEQKGAKADLEKAKRGLKERKTVLDEAEEEMKELLQSGAAAAAEDFRKRAETYRGRTDLEKKRRDALDRLQRLSGPGEPLEALKKQLGDTDIQAIRDEKRRVEEEYTDADAEVRELSTERGSIQAQRDGLTGEEESSRLRTERHRLLEEMRGHAREWTVRTIAENLLQEARGKFEKERQPDVVRNAETFFKGITNERYQTVFSPLGSSEIHVMDSRGDPKQPSQLSRGTREQLFLSLRFGLVRELGQRSERLPVVVDEALVNFDPRRGMRAAGAFVELAQTNQVLVFTCHPQMVEWFVSAASERSAEEPEVVAIG